ncbi:zinc ribbon domain-containing protein [candidate division WOR-3 bacterium]|nr:zinc ribbon domain-containing protein [candidate division WOR-3 bacterium]
MSNIGKKICPRCNYLGKDRDSTCPYCGLKLISQCPRCGAPIKVAFAEYCYICGFRFENVTNKSKRKEEMKKDKETGRLVDRN